MLSLKPISPLQRIAGPTARRTFSCARVVKATHAHSAAQAAAAASKPLAVKQRINLPEHPRLAGIVLPPLKSNPTVGPSNNLVGDRTRKLRGTKNGVVVGTPIFLPNIVFCLVRNKTPPGQAYNPYEATFRVPLPITKNDIKSYLLAVYGVETTYVNTDIRRPAAIHPNRYKLRRKPLRIAKSYKRAVVGLVEPFYYPDSFSDAGEKEREIMVEHHRLRLGLHKDNLDTFTPKQFATAERRMLMKLPDAQYSVGKKQHAEEKAVARASEEEKRREKIAQRRTEPGKGV